MCRLRYLRTAGYCAPQDSKYERSESHSTLLLGNSVIRLCIPGRGKGMERLRQSRFRHFTVSMGSRSSKNFSTCTFKIQMRFCCTPQLANTRGRPVQSLDPKGVNFDRSRLSKHLDGK